jgi:hypothetical protein
MKRGLSYIEAIGFYASAWGQRWSKLSEVVSLTCNFLLIGIWTYLPCGVPLLEAYAVSPTSGPLAQTRGGFSTLVYIIPARY